MKTMKLKSIQTYQYVVFKNQNRTFLMDSKELGLVGLELEYYPEMMAVKAKCGTDEIIIFCTNIAYARPFGAEGNDLNRAKIKDKNPGDSIR